MCTFLGDYESSMFATEVGLFRVAFPAAFRERERQLVTGPYLSIYWSSSLIKDTLIELRRSLGTCPVTSTLPTFAWAKNALCLSPVLGTQLLLPPSEKWIFISRKLLNNKNTVIMVTEKKFSFINADGKNTENLLTCWKDEKWLMFGVEDWWDGEMVASCPSVRTK